MLGAPLADEKEHATSVSVCNTGKILGWSQGPHELVQATGDQLHCE